MMNKSAIDWCDFTWNPVTGCPNGCHYCYARKQAARFSGDIRLNKASPQITHAGGGTYILEQPFKNSKDAVIQFPAGFEPTFHRYRLPMPAQKKKPAAIFVCSMGDLFAPVIPTKWIVDVFDACADAPWHTYLFLTKYPQRYEQLEHLAILPHESNFWYGTTITRAAELERIGCLPMNANRFISIEPILEPIDIDARPLHSAIPYADWVIVGAETGNQKTKTTPERAWLEAIIENAHLDHIPILLKDSKELRAVWGGKPLREFPPQLQHTDIPMPHCRECEHRRETQQGARGTSYSCEIGWEAEGYDDRDARHVPGSYTRTSPPWCPKRKGEKQE